MENDVECLADRRGLGGYSSEEFVKRYCSYVAQVITFSVT